MARQHFFLAGATYRRAVPAVSDTLLAEFETQRGLRLPNELVDLLRIQNGGVVRYNVFMIGDQAYHFNELAGIGATRYGSHDLLTAEPVTDEQGIDISQNVLVLDSDAHSKFGLDYRNCGQRGEPSVIYITDWCDITLIQTVATGFSQLVDGLQRGESDYYLGIEGVEEPQEFAQMLAKRLNARLDDNMARSSKTARLRRFVETIKNAFRVYQDYWQPTFRLRRSSWRSLEGVDLVPNIDYATHYTSKHTYHRPAGLLFPEHPECNWLLKCSLPPREFTALRQQVEDYEYRIRVLHQPVFVLHRDDPHDDSDPEADVVTSDFVQPDRVHDFDGIQVEWPGTFGFQGAVMSTKDSNPEKNDYRIIGNYDRLAIVQGQLSLESGTGAIKFGKVSKGDRIQVMVDRTVLINGKPRLGSPRQFDQK